MIIRSPVIICDYCHRLITRKDDEANWAAFTKHTDHYCDTVCETCDAIKGWPASTTEERVS